MTTATKCNVDVALLCSEEIEIKLDCVKVLERYGDGVNSIISCRQALIFGALRAAWQMWVASALDEIKTEMENLFKM